MRYQSRHSTEPPEAATALFLSLCLRTNFDAYVAGGSSPGSLQAINDRCSGDKCSQSSAQTPDTRPSATPLPKLGWVSSMPMTSDTAATSSFCRRAESLPVPLRAVAKHKVSPPHWRNSQTTISGLLTCGLPDLFTFHSHSIHAPSATSTTTEATAAPLALPAITVTRPALVVTVEVSSKLRPVRHRKPLDPTTIAATAQRVLGTSPCT
mmetsp:Transcript_17221/g.42214  ORF Transcript_17221/g.42214 Transcript_17221/m.42214 type:complete len:209 (-) Transcript_17221:2134-2760(-)